MPEQQTVNPGVVTFVVVRCVCGKPQPFSAPLGVTVRFYCSDRGCYRHKFEQVVTLSSTR
jgi:hypothetical protein